MGYAGDSHLAWPWRTRTRSTRGTKGMVQNSKTGQHAPAPTSQCIPAAEMENHGKPMKLWRCETGLNHVWLSQPGWDDFSCVTVPGNQMEPVRPSAVNGAIETTVAAKGPNSPRTSQRGHSECRGASQTAQPGSCSCPCPAGDPHSLELWHAAPICRSMVGHGITW